MSETPVYVLLAQLNSVMTGGLRLALAFAALTLLAWGGSVRSRRCLDLAPYLNAWVVFLALMGLGTSLWEKALLPYQNPFVNQGVWLSGGLLLVGGGALGLQALPFWQRSALMRSLLALIFGLSWFWSLFLPSFSRSDKTLFSTLMAVPVAISLAYFVLLLTGQERRFARILHATWALSLPVNLLIYYLWLWPLLAGIPQAGEFFPFIHLYDWFLMAFVILYLGNVYIDYWLKQTTRNLALSWNYLVLVSAILCLWLNTNIFDTLAL